MLWQPIRPFEFTSPVVDVIKYRLLSIKPISTIIFANSYLRSKLTVRQINERILRYPLYYPKCREVFWTSGQTRVQFSNACKYGTQSHLT